MGRKQSPCPVPPYSHEPDGEYMSLSVYTRCMAQRYGYSPIFSISTFRTVISSWMDILRRLILFCLAFMLAMVLLLDCSSPCNRISSSRSLSIRSIISFFCMVKTMQVQLLELQTLFSDYSCLSVSLPIFLWHYYRWRWHDNIAGCRESP